ncbi:hypothetical protein OYC64_014138 [Pagothenia borchgrevinki]|uniref:C-type lectin domain-containing protein n=1 Tax=Pagothenia borchgrevinki TaxID=8213 RepID=A0ABD2H0X6_PAGBO
MPEAEVLYSDVKFKRDKGNNDGSASSAADTTYSAVRILEKQPELPAHQNIRTIARLQKMIDERDAEMKDLTGGSCKRCPDGWEPHGGKCYYFSINEATWTRSRAACRRTGGDLVKIESTEEQESLEQKVRGEMTEEEDKFWIGLTDSETEGTWLWTDGSPLDSGLTFWFKGEPDNFKGIDTMGEDCARMGERGGATDLKCWFDQSCEDPHKSICEKPEDPNSLRI